MGNLTGNVFDDGVIDQIEARQTFLGARYKTDSNLIYGNNTTSFLRLASSVNVEPDRLKERSLSETLQGDLLAKSCVLFGGTVGIDDTLNPKRKFGIVDNGGKVFDYVSTIAAYGWGGIDKGFSPMPNMESAEISFYNRGALQKATVKIKVSSLQQLQIFDLLYFRIGYTMLLEWGHNIWLNNNIDLEKNPNPINTRTEFVTEPFRNFFTVGKSQQDIIASISKQRKDENYNYDAMLGKVTNFTWKFNDDGTYDIDLNLIGLGDIIESLKINKSNIAKSTGPVAPTDQQNLDALGKKKEKLEEKKNESTPDGQTALVKFNEKIASVQKAINTQKGYWVNNVNNLITINYALSANQKALVSQYVSAVKQTVVTVTQQKSANIQTLESVQALLEQQGGIRGFVPDFATRRVDANATMDGAKNNIEEIKRLINSISDADYGAVAQATAANNAKVQQISNELKKIQEQENALKKQIETKKLSPITSVENKDKTSMNVQLFKWRQDAEKSTLDKKNLYKLTLSATSESNSANKLVLNFYYVRLGYLLEWIEKNLLIYDTTKPPQPNPNSDLAKLSDNPIFEIDYDIESNFCLRFPTQFSTDPAICIIPSSYSSSTTKWNVLPELKAYFVDKNDFAGKLMNLFVNIDHTAGVLDSNTDVNGKTNLLKFLSSLCNNINDSLGNVNKLEPIFDSDSNKLKIIEGSSLENLDDLLKSAEDKISKVKNKMGVFQVYGIGTDKHPQGSFITNVDFQVQLPPNMAAMATISAQANGNIIGENATGLSKMNTGLTDRLITFKLDRDSIEGAPGVGELDPLRIFNGNIEVVSKFVTDLYASKNYNRETVENTRSSNRDIALYLTGQDALADNMPAPFFIPFNLTVNMKGLSGMRNYERFSITEKVLPYSYRTGDQGGVIDFLIKGISHSIKDNKWETKIESLTVGSNRRKLYNKDKQ